MAIFEDTEYPAIPIMDAIPYKGEGEFFDVDATEEEIEGMNDNNGVIFFMKVMERCLPKFDDRFGKKFHCLNGKLSV